MSNVLPDVRSVIQELGDVSGAASLCGVRETAVFNWIARERFPAHTYFVIRDKLKAKRKSAPDDLWKRRARVPDASLPQVVSPAGA